jgi:hypothetical protein
MQSATAGASHAHYRFSDFLGFTLRNVCLTVLHTAYLVDDAGHVGVGLRCRVDKSRTRICARVLYDERLRAEPTEFLRRVVNVETPSDDGVSSCSCT